MTTSHRDYRIALYYCYIQIADVDRHIDFHRESCSELKLNGRIRVAREGINGVLSGMQISLLEYEKRLREEMELDTGDGSELDVKYCRLREDLLAEEQLFDSLLIQATDQVVSLVEPPTQPPKRISRRRQIQPLVGDGQSTVDPVQVIWAMSRNDRVGASHLSPSEWNRHLEELSIEEAASIAMLDCRNYYESNIGRFSAPQAETVLTNTRKYSELPQVLVEQADELAGKTHIFMYCTGGVRCERASVFLKNLLETKSARPQIYQLHGGIQRYLESDDARYYQGKNFVFDRRRFDPQQDGRVVGRCLVCEQPHDDYDNGQAPQSGHEARCCQCRSLILVCDACRVQVQCWGESSSLPKMLCGGKEAECIHRPPVQIMRP